jgi:hypothetical protein
VVVQGRLPSRQRRQLDALAVPAPPGPAKGLIALIEMFLGCLA